MVALTLNSGLMDWLLFVTASATGRRVWTTGSIDQRYHDNPCHLHAEYPAAWVGVLARMLLYSRVRTGHGNLEKS